MSKTDTPAKVASNDQLGLVPEHTAFEAAMTADGYTLDFLILDGGRRYAYMEAEWALRGWDAAAAAERERIALAWDGCVHEGTPCNMDIGASIRAGELVPWVGGA